MGYGIAIAGGAPGFTVRLIWHSILDGHTCPVCAWLNGKVYTEADVYNDKIYDLFWGPIYDLAAGTSLAHGDPVRIIGTIGHNCRCQVEAVVTVEPAKMPELATLEELLLGSSRQTALGDIGATI